VLTQCTDALKAAVAAQVPYVSISELQEGTT
jgi:hypothetical protein